MARLPVPAPWEREESVAAWIYGAILVAAAVAYAGDRGEDTAGEVVLVTAAPIVVIWLAHSYAEFVAHGGRVDLPSRSARLIAAMRTQTPMLAAAVPTLAALAIAWNAGASATGAGEVGLTVAIVTMVVVATGTARRQGAGRMASIAAGASCLLLGGIIVAAKIAIG